MRHNGARMKTFLDRIDYAVDHTPASRNRVADLWRVVALLAVVFGHWLAASVWVDPDGEIIVMNTLEWIPHAAWFTWVIQVMPVFFFVGGYANAKALENRSSNRRSWLTIRFRRLYAPAVPVIVLWTLLTVVLREFIDEDLIYAGVLNATIPLWFLGVYLALISIAPLTHKLWERFDLWSFFMLAGGAVAVDVAYRVFDVPGIGWLNLIFVWGAVHQLGYWWADRERDRSVMSPFYSTGLAVSALTALIAVTWADLYPVAMITIPGAGPQNVTPPTSALILLGLTQAGIILATFGPVRRFAGRRPVWKGVVGVSGFMMSIYVWHLTVLSLLIAVGAFAFDGIAFSLEPGTAVWWLTRPVFYVVLITVTAGFVAVFGVFERDIDTSDTDRPMVIVVVGMGLTIFALAMTAFVYIVDREANLTWWIPATAVVASLIMGAYPSRWRR